MKLGIFVAFTLLDAETFKLSISSSPRQYGRFAVLQAGHNLRASSSFNHLKTKLRWYYTHHFIDLDPAAFSAYPGHYNEAVNKYITCVNIILFCRYCHK